MNTNRKALMRKIQMYAFVAHECALYLDCHPENKRALEKHSAAVKSMNEAIAQYQEMYGPLTANAAWNGKPATGWSWIYGKWPWQGEED